MKKITLIKSFLHQIGGVEKNVWHIAEAFAKRGWQPSILTTQWKEGSVDGIQIRSFFIKKNLPNFYKLLRFDALSTAFLQKSDSSVILGMDRTTYQTHLRAGNGSHRAFLDIRKKNEGFFKKASFLCNPLHKSALYLEKKAFTSPILRKLIVNSHMVKKEILHYYDVPDKKIVVIHNGVEWNELETPFSQTFNSKRNELKKRHLSADKFYLLFMGNGYARKNLITVLQALSILQKKFIHLFVVGKEKNLNFYKKVAKKLGVNSQITFCGSQKKVSLYYQICDSLILPTLYDPFANVTLEALSMGLSIITSKNNGAHEILQPFHGKTIQNPLDAEEIAFALEKLLQKRKTDKSASLIRESVQTFDYSIQLDSLLDTCIHE